MKCLNPSTLRPSESTRFSMTSLVFIYLISLFLAKLKVLALLNQEFFDEVFKREEEELSNI